MNWRTSTFTYANGSCVEVANDWRKSSRSSYNGNCVEAGTFRKSSYSHMNGNCAEVATAPAGVLVRDTTDRGGAMLAIPAGAWIAFTDSLKNMP